MTTTLTTTTKSGLKTTKTNTAYGTQMPRKMIQIPISTMTIHQWRMTIQMIATLTQLPDKVTAPIHNSAARNMMTI